MFPMPAFRTFMFSCLNKVKRASKLPKESAFTIIPSSTSSSCKMEEDLEQEFKESKSILIKVSKMIMDITASDDFSIKLENSHRVLDMVQKMLHL